MQPGEVIKKISLWGAWLAQSVERLTSAQVMISDLGVLVLESSPAHICICIRALCLSGSLLVPLPFPLLMLACSLSLKVFNKIFFKSK